MRVVVISDVHGNAFALQAVLREIEQCSPDLVINLGDQVEGYAHPAQAADLQLGICQRWPTLEVRGNNEEKFWPNGRRRPLSIQCGEWLDTQLSTETIARLSRLPLTETALDGKIFACHGTPSNCWKSLLWSWKDDKHKTGQGHYVAPDPRQLREVIAPLGADIVLCGHTHRAGMTCLDDTLIVNVGAISDQADGDPRARWAILERRFDEWQVSFRRTVYDVEAAVTWAQQHSPMGDFATHLLRNASFVERNYMRSAHDAGV